jgi:hypothetical protein
MNWNDVLTLVSLEDSEVWIEHPTASELEDMTLT